MAGADWRLCLTSPIGNSLGVMKNALKEKILVAGVVKFVQLSPGSVSYIPGYAYRPEHFSIANDRRAVGSAGERRRLLGC